MASAFRASLNKLGLAGPRSKTVFENLPGRITVTAVSDVLTKLDTILDLQRNWRVEQIAPCLAVIEPTEVA